MINIPCLLLAVLLLGVTSASSDQQTSFYSLPNIHQKSYSQLGDINIGALIVTDFSTPGGCLQTVRPYTTTIEQTEAVAFAIDHVNRSPHILPNVSLGFVIRGICRYPGPSVATSLLFLPRNTKGTDGLLYANTSSPPTTTNDRTHTPRDNDEDASDWLGHDVIGVLSTGWSRTTLPISALYAVGELPIVGPTETDVDFSDKRHHPYFFRIVPPQVHQVEAILKFIRDHGWSFISVLYSDCTLSLTMLVENIDQYGICIGTMHKLSTSSNTDVVAADLLANSRARVVVTFLSSSVFKKVLRSVVKLNGTGHFIWIGSNLFDSYRGLGLEENAGADPGIGSFFFDTFSKEIPEFYTHLRNFDAYKTNNPWLKPIWEIFLNCSLEKKTCNPNANILQTSKYKAGKGTSLRVDAVLTLAQAAHDLLADKCPDARGQEARACITGQLLREYLKNVSFNGLVAPVKLNENQDNLGKYSIKQLVYGYPKYFDYQNLTKTRKSIFGDEIGTYDVATGAFDYKSGELSWSHLNKLERIVPWTIGSIPRSIPESVCSRPCLPGEYKIEKKVSCCWECRTCRENERFTKGNTSCEACPSFTWPDPASGFTTCTDLPLTYSTLLDTIPLVLTSLAFIALVVTVAISVTYVIYRNERVIKASSRELSFLQLVAIFVGYSTIILFQTVPSDAMCSVIFFLFCMSFAMLYCPLLAKASRIFRIFKSGAKNERPRFISPQSQVLFSASLITIQITLCVATYILFTPKAVKIQPVWTEKLVELSCDLTLPGLASFLGYNIVLVSVCSVFAFLTRSLPDNFNESKFISMCVSTTLLIWLAFIPTYFTASREFVRVFLLSVALFLNHSVALIFLFVPKIYAAIFITATDGHVSKKANS